MQVCAIQGSLGKHRIYNKVGYNVHVETQFVLLGGVGEGCGVLLFKLHNTVNEHDLFCSTRSSQ